MKRSHKIGFSIGVIVVIYLLYFFLSPTSEGLKADSRPVFVIMNSHMESNLELNSNEESQIIYYFLQHQKKIYTSYKDRKLMSDMQQLYSDTRDYLKYTDPKEKRFPMDVFVEVAPKVKKVIYQE